MKGKNALLWNCYTLCGNAGEFGTNSLSSGQAEDIDKRHLQTIKSLRCNQWLLSSSSSHQDCWQPPRGVAWVLYFPWPPSEQAWQGEAGRLGERKGDKLQGRFPGQFPKSGVSPLLRALDWSSGTSWLSFPSAHPLRYKISIKMGKKYY